ncbi:hypothetical protein PTSG_09843 [Salpingoeca rosetta]|uniref:Peptidase S9 prolyl oligopeptidase catalytic domain-containing protein n=1 Tax=Salpingoeca rosetta (strain ATCC 50818 / BSB-021) TaxID=946362 RepID=F2UNB1_SALR5|nr:uncharacterized protein PTSG_09843 [Salpingoeca rosetta]EGD79116.1 hypothetical protein PTSG_09843 [Salpingoeca rosetta]|eukprot:XP_004989201.1 hypothetical protein PTSG_09843 [Salpingoeca rosetta]
MTTTPPQQPRVDARIAALCGPGKDVVRPSAVFVLNKEDGDDDAAIIVCERKASTLQFYRSQGAGNTVATLDDSLTLTDVDGFFPISDTAFAYQKGQDVKLYDFATKETSDVCTLPARASEVCITYSVDAGATVACFQPDERCKDAPLVLPCEPAAKTLLAHRPLAGWATVCVVPETAERLTIASDGRLCAYAVMTNVIPEEAERGEVVICRLAPAATPHQARRVTADAGRVGEVVFTHDSTAILYTANYSEKRPITTHCPLFACPIKSALMATTDDDRILLSPQQTHVQQLVQGVASSSILITLIEGVAERSLYLADWRHPEQAAELLAPATTPCVAVTAGDDTRRLCFISESHRRYPHVVCVDAAKGSVAREVDLPHDAEFDDIRVDIVSYTSHDDTAMEMLHCYTAETKADASLLVHAHGGPAVAFTAHRTAAASNVRYPYRQLLKSGYRVIMPLFRGTLGYGDKFAQANIGCQGRHDSDLGDILAAIQAMRKSGFAFEDRIGIFGGSYGGYMTLRSLAITDTFKAGVAMYGFVHGRFMSLEGGDFTWEVTWEDEYVGKQAWPITDATIDSDVFHQLGNITAPTLLLHGDEDDICLKSSSLVAYRALHTRGIPTGCIIYPGEGHGFENPVYQRDRDLRLLKWFLAHVPPTPA